MNPGKRLILLTLILNSFAFVNAQDPIKPDCPTLTVAAPDKITEGNPAVFSVEIKNLKGQATYNWSISNGTIEAGQGTATITVDSKGLGGGNITATVELGGLAAGCASTSSSTIYVEAVKKPAELYSKNEYSTAAAFTTVLDRFTKSIDRLSPDPLAGRVIVLYPGKETKAASNMKEMERLVYAAFTKAGIDQEKYYIMNGGLRAKSYYELFIVPTGANQPVPDPPL